MNVDPNRIDELLKKVGLYENKKQDAGKLSKGQKQRLIIARSILHSPKILFLDEPTSGLDPKTANSIQNLLFELRKEGMAIFLTTHNMDEATKLCNHVALLDQGVIIEYGSPQEICLRHNTDRMVKVMTSDQKIHVFDDMVALADYIKNNPFETLHSNEPTLEDVFINVTGKELSK